MRQRFERQFKKRSAPDDSLSGVATRGTGVTANRLNHQDANLYGKWVIRGKRPRIVDPNGCPTCISFN
jgi:hypothetical protein